MRGGGIRSRRQQWHDGRIIAAEIVNAARACIVDFGNQIAFTHARLDFIDDALVHGFHDATGFAHIADLG